MAQEWSRMNERGAYWGLWTVAWIYRLLGRTVCRAVLAPVAAWFWISGRMQREASLDYLRRAHAMGWLKHRPGWASGLRHFTSFAWGVLDKLAAWTGAIKPAHIDGVHDGLFHEAKFNGKGGVVLTAHIGSPDIVRAVATVNRRFRVNVLMHTLHAENYNRILGRFSPDAPVRLVQVTQIDLGVAMQLSEAVSRGEWVVMAADRVGVVDGETSAATVRFMGGQALAPLGPFILAAALKCPVYAMFCLPGKGRRHRVTFERITEQLDLPRRARDQALAACAQDFAERMERALAGAPFQWFNFYPYWSPPDTAKGAES